MRPKRKSGSRLGAGLGAALAIAPSQPVTALTVVGGRPLEFTTSVGVTMPAEVTFQTVEVYLAALQHRRGCKASTANRHRYALQEFFRYLARERVIVGNPAADTFSLKQAQRLPDDMTIPQQERLLEAMIPDHSPIGQRDLALVGVMLFTGLRVSEVVNLRLEHVDLEAGVLRVAAGKGDKDRELPIVPRLARFLYAYLSDGRPRLVGRPIGRIYLDAEGAWIHEYWTWIHEYKAHRAVRRNLGMVSEAEATRVLTQDGGWFFVNAHRSNGHRQRAQGQLLTRSVHALLRYGRVARILGRPSHPHEFRHSFASRLRENGADLALIQEALGHANIGPTMIYAHLSTPKRRQDLARLLETPPAGTVNHENG